jgi:transposase
VDDGLYLPVIAQITQTLPEPGLLFVGDSQMSAVATRATVQQQGHSYLMPLPMTGKTPELWDEWTAGPDYSVARLTARSRQSVE